MYRGGWRVPRLGSHPRDYWLNRKRIRLRRSEIAALTKPCWISYELTGMDTDIERGCESCPWLRVRILRQIAHLRSYTLLFALAYVPEDHRIIESTNVSDQ
jgi:hypothetical protein